MCFRPQGALGICVCVYVRMYRSFNLKFPTTAHAGPVQSYCTRPRHKQPYHFNDAGGTDKTGYSHQTPQYERTQDHPDGSESEEGTKRVHAPYFSCLPPLKRAQKDLAGKRGGGTTTLRTRNSVPPYPTTDAYSVVISPSPTRKTKSISW